MDKVKYLDKIINYNNELVDLNQGDTSECIGFDFNGTFIINPLLDETGRFNVEPFQYYGENNIETFINRAKELSI